MYKNVIKHAHYGHLEYEVTLRNWNGMGNSRDQNLAMGPCFELILCEYSLVAAGTTLVEAEDNLVKLLDLSQEHRLINLRFLCPNCHSQTETYTGKNSRGTKKKRGG